MVKCYKCEHNNKEGHEFCEECGSKLIIAQKCHKCGHKTNPNNDFCEECGAKVGGKKSYKKLIVISCAVVLIIILLIFLLTASFKKHSINNTSVTKVDNVAQSLTDTKNAESEEIKSGNIIISNEPKVDLPTQSEWKLKSPTDFKLKPDTIIVNSENWVDVYSVLQYGALTGKTSRFLVSDTHATGILNQIGKNEHIWAITSTKVPYVRGYQELMTAEGYSAEEFKFDNINLEMVLLLDDIDSFIIVDPSHGYNALSVAPYAALIRSYTLFTDKNTINGVADFLSSRSVKKIIIYGQVDPEVEAALQQYSPEIINKEGDKFLNNIEIVKKYMEVRPGNQVIFTNGEFIEQEIMSGTQPVIFIGIDNVPNSVRDYIQKSNIEVGILIGNELASTATSIRRELGISVFVKFAQGAKPTGENISQVEALDIFYTE